MAGPYEGFGSDLLKGNTTLYTTSTVWTSVGCVQSITPPNPAIEDVSLPLCVNASNRAREFVPGAYDPGEASYTILFEAGDVQEAIDALGDEGAWSIKLGDSGKYYRFNGYFKGFSLPEITAEGFISLTCTLKVSGQAAEVTGS